MTWTADGRMRVRPGVMARGVDDITVLLDAGSGRYFQLDDIGSRAWTLMAEGRRISDVVAELLLMFEAEPETVTRDLVSLAARLEAAGLVERLDDGH